MCKLNMFTVGVVMLSYLAGKALICRGGFCEFVPFCLQSMTTGSCSQHKESMAKGILMDLGWTIADVFVLLIGTISII